MRYPVRNMKHTFKGASQDCYMGVRGFTCSNESRNKEDKGITIKAKKIVPVSVWDVLLKEKVSNKEDPWEGL